MACCTARRLFEDYRYCTVTRADFAFPSQTLYMDNITPPEQVAKSDITGVIHKGNASSHHTMLHNIHSPAVRHIFRVING